MKKTCVLILVLTMLCSISINVGASEELPPAEPMIVTGTVYFDTNGGSYIEPVKVAAGEMIYAPETPTKPGYVFDGWYYQPNCWDVYRETFPYRYMGLFGTYTYYARWKDENAVSKPKFSIEGNTNDDVEVKLIPVNSDEVKYDITIGAGVASGNNYVSDYEFDEGIEVGTYKVIISKKNHVTREYEIEATADGIQTNDCKINLVGDISGDGRVDISDVKSTYSEVKEEGFLLDYAFKCADVNNDQKVNITDVSMVYNHVSGNKSLWS